MSLLERVYFFHAKLNSNRYPNARTLMQEFEISLATARRDIAYLRDRLLAPLAYDPNQNGFYYTENDFNLPFENSPRIAFLLGMLNRLAEETGLSGLPEIHQLEKRLSSIIAQDYNHLINSIHCEWVEVEHPEPRTFDTIIEAIVSRRRLKIIYRSPWKDRSERDIEPIKLLNYQGRWYLSAWCLLRNDLRIFHLARIRAVNLGEIFPPREPDTRLESLESSFGIFKGPPRYRAEILFYDTAAELVRNQIWHKHQSITETVEGIMLSLPVNDDREIIMKVLQYGSKAKVLNPLQLQEKVRAEISRMSELNDLPPLERS